MAFWTNRFRFFLLLIFFWYNMCLQLIYRNLVFTLPAMIDHKYFDQSRTIVNDVANMSNTCAPPDREVAEDKLNGPYKWDDYTQSLFLSLEAVGMLVGTMSAIFLYNYCFMRPIVTICLIWGGLLNIFAPEIVGGGGAYGLIISRFAVGIYVGLVVPTPNLACALWFTEDEKNVALTFAYLGYNVGAMYFSLAGVINSSYGWQANFRIPGFISLICGIFFLIFFTDDPGENIFISEEETKLLKRPRIRPVTSTSPLNEKSKNNKDKLVGRYRIVTAITNIQIARRRAKKKAPLMQALTYLPIWAVLMGSFGVSWYLESVIVYTQFYLIEMHKFSLGRTSFLNSIPTNLSMLIFGVFGSQFTEYLIRQKCLEKLTVRRIGAGVICLGTVYLLLIGYLSCEEIENNIGLLLILSSLRAGYYFSVAPSAIDISPTYQSTLVAANNAAMLIPGFTVPMVMSAVGDENARTKGDWKIIFLISYCIINASMIFYAFTTTSEVLPFDDAALKDKKSDEETSKIRPSPLLVTTRDFDPAGHFALSIKRKWILDGESNDCKCIWDMDEDEDNVQAVLDDVHEDMKSVEPSLHSAFPMEDVEKEHGSSQLSAKTIRVSPLPESAEAQNAQEQEVKGKEKDLEKTKADVDDKKKEEKQKKKAHEVLPKEEKSKKHKKKKPIKIKEKVQHPIEVAKNKAI